jgi:hypothetical protein
MLNIVVEKGIPIPPRSVQEVKLTLRKLFPTMVPGDSFVAESNYVRKIAGELAEELGLKIISRRVEKGRVPCRVWWLVSKNGQSPRYTTGSDKRAHRGGWACYWGFSVRFPDLGTPSGTCDDSIEAILARDTAELLESKLEMGIIGESEYKLRGWIGKRPDGGWSRLDSGGQARFDQAARWTVKRMLYTKITAINKEFVTIFTMEWRDDDWEDPFKTSLKIRHEGNPKEVAYDFHRQICVDNN